MGGGGEKQKQIPHYVRDDTEKKSHNGEEKAAGLKPHTYTGRKKRRGVYRETYHAAGDLRSVDNNQTHNILAHYY